MVESIRYWVKLWPKRGFIGAFDAALDGYGVLQRILTSTYGERAATDLRHLTELCHAEERRTRTGPLDWPSGCARSGWAPMRKMIPSRFASRVTRVRYKSSLSIKARSRMAGGSAAFWLVRLYQSRR